MRPAVHLGFHIRAVNLQFPLVQSHYSAGQDRLVFIKFHQNSPKQHESKQNHLFSGLKVISLLERDGSLWERDE